MKKVIFAFITLMMWSVASIASTYNIIVPNTPGSSSDLVARAVAEEYHRVTGKTLVLDYAPGADQVTAANRFVNRKDLTVLLGTTTIHVFNPVVKENLPYADTNFSHVGWIGWTPHIWYVRSDSSIKTLSDILNRLDQNQNINVGVDGQSTQVNVKSLKKYRKSTDSLIMVPYKGSPQTLADVLGGHIDAGVSSLSAGLVEQHVAGKIRVLAVTTERPIKLVDQQIPSAEKIFSVPQFNGGFLLSIASQQADTTEGKQLATDLYRVINSDFVRQKLSAIQIQVDGGDGKKTSEVINNYRQFVKILLN